MAAAEPARPDACSRGCLSTCHRARSKGSRPPGRRAVADTIATVLALGLALTTPSAFAFDLADLTALLAQTPSGEATFIEKKRIEMLDRTLESSGRLAFRSPDVFVRETHKPTRELLAVEGNRVTLARGDLKRTTTLDSVPEAAVIVDAIRGTLTGDRATLERVFTVTVAGDARQWTLDLVPRDARLRGQVASLRVSGREALLREVQMLLADGDRSTMTITPVAAGASTAAPSPAPAVKR